jgi:hypothetical protein
VQHRRDLVLDPGPPLDQPASARNQPTQHPAALITDPDPGDQPGGQQIGQHARVDLVGLHARMADRPHVLRVRQHHLGHMRRKYARDRHRVARRLQHHAISRRQAPREQLKLLRRARDPPSRPCPAAVGDSDLTEVAMDIQPDRTSRPFH